MDSKSKRIIAAAEEIIRVSRMTNREFKAEFEGALGQGSNFDAIDIPKVRAGVLRDLVQNIFFNL